MPMATTAATIWLLVRVEVNRPMDRAVAPYSANPRYPVHIGPGSGSAKATSRMT